MPDHKEISTMHEEFASFSRRADVMGTKYWEQATSQMTRQEMLERTSKWLEYGTGKYLLIERVWIAGG